MTAVLGTAAFGTEWDRTGRRGGGGLNHNFDDTVGVRDGKNGVTT